ncbi:MAG: transcription termination factor NusA [Finegoldia sp.]|nr:transcription termination factor NusA [Finegoldia sp.]
MNKEFIAALDELEKTKKIPKDLIIDSLEKALVKSYEKNYNYQDPEEKSDLIEAKVDRETGDIEIYVVKEVVEDPENESCEISLEKARTIDSKCELGDRIKLKETPKDFGRIAAQTTRNIMIQQIKDAERNNIYNEFVEREKEIITGTVQRIDRGSVFIDLGRVEGIIPVSEQISQESYEPNQRLKLYIKEVRNTTKGAQIILSRTDPNLIKRLFELEIPEISDGTVEIFNIAREAGSRTKIAVYSNDPNVDPVGACVGLSGARVKSIVDELNGEKLDIVVWSKDIKTFIANSLSPSEVIETFIDNKNKVCRVIVDENQLSLAIGKEGQNARLAAKLTNWKIDIKGLNQYIKEYKGETIGIEFEGEKEFLQNLGVEVRQADLEKDFEDNKDYDDVDFDDLDFDEENIDDNEDDKLNENFEIDEEEN